MNGWGAAALGLLVMMIVIKSKRGNRRFWDGMDLDGDEQSRAVRVTETKELLVGSAALPCWALLGSFLAGLWQALVWLAGLGKSKKEAPASPRQGQGEGKVACAWMDVVCRPGQANRHAGDPKKQADGGDR